MPTKTDSSRRILHRGEKQLYVPLSGSELETLANELSEVIGSISVEKDDQTDAKAQMKARLTELEARMTRIAATVRLRKELRLVEFEQFVDGEEAVTIRLDTGEEVGRRILTANERQGELISEHDG